jgi:hypothetical protein
VLVDAPHLAERCPSLISAKPTLNSLSASLRLRPNLAIFKDKGLAQAKLKKPFWFDRPVWFWTEIERLRLTKEIKDPWKTSPNSFVFCEDTSSFSKRSSAQTFQSDLISPYRTRYVSRVAGVDYQPAHRLAMS